MWQAHHDTEFFLSEARTKLSQRDINQSLIMAIEKLAREVKAIQNEIHKIRSDVRRRFLQSL